MKLARKFEIIARGSSTTVGNNNDDDKEGQNKQNEFHNECPGIPDGTGGLVWDSSCEFGSSVATTIPVCDFIAWQTGGASNFALADRSFAIQLCNSTGLISAPPVSPHALSSSFFRPFEFRFRVPRVF